MEDEEVVLYIALIRKEINSQDGIWNRDKLSENVLLVQLYLVKLRDYITKNLA